MDFHFSGVVRHVDGAEMGHLRHLVLEPQERRLVAVVVEHGVVRGHAVIVPVGSIESTDADGDEVYLRLGAEDQERLSQFREEERNITSPPADVDARTIPSGDAPAPVGAAQGETMIAFIPLLDVMQNAPEGTVVVDDETEVLALDSRLGTLERVRTDDATNRITSLVAESDGIFTRELVVANEQVSVIDFDAITLNVDRAAILAARPG